MIYSTDELIDLADGAGALLPCSSAHLDAAEIALLLMLGAARRAAEGDRLIRARQWRLWSPAFMVGTQITGKTSGIIGMGRVGRGAARRARGFQRHIHYHNRRRVPAEIEPGRGLP